MPSATDTANILDRYRKILAERFGYSDLRLAARGNARRNRRLQFDKTPYAVKHVHGMHRWHPVLLPYKGDESSPLPMRSCRRMVAINCNLNAIYPPVAT